MTCSAPACKANAKYAINFEAAESAITRVGEEWYECEDREYCSKHMLEQLDFLMNLVAENEKV